MREDFLFGRRLRPILANHKNEWRCFGRDFRRVGCSFRHGFSFGMGRLWAAQANTPNSTQQAKTVVKTEAFEGYRGSGQRFWRLRSNPAKITAFG